MASITRGDLTVIPGVRVERTEGKTSAIGVTPTSTVNDTYNQFGQYAYTDWFPSVNVKYSFSPRLLSRGAVTTALGRPNYSDLASTLAVSQADNEVALGNPDLQPQKADGGGRQDRHPRSFRAACGPSGRRCDDRGQAGGRLRDGSGAHPLRGRDARRARRRRDAERITAQLAVIAQAAPAAFAIAYEPVWAIGSQVSATPSQIETVHRHIRSRLRDMGVGDAELAPILYGGAVTELSAPGILDMPEVGGLLVGSASLRATTFMPIMQAAAVRGKATVSS